VDAKIPKWVFSPSSVIWCKLYFCKGNGHFEIIIMSVVMSMLLPLAKYYCIVAPRVLGALLRILFYSFLLSSFSLSLLYTIPFYSLHPCSERWLIQPDCTVLGTTFIYSKSNTEILGTLSLCWKQSEKKPKSLTAELVGCTYWSLWRGKQNITKVRSCEYFSRNDVCSFKFWNRRLEVQ